jgi:hypothetical protein
MLTIQEVISKFPAEVRARYDFTAAAYHGALERITGIQCPEHGEFSQYPAQLRKPDGAGCPRCGDVVRRAKRRSSLQDVIAAANAKHDGAYSYAKTDYVNSSTKMTVTCPEHGDFSILPNNHLAGKGCPGCGALKRGRRKNVADAARRTAETKIAEYARQFEGEARGVHGTAYDYSRVRYAGRKGQLEIICPAHGSFFQTAEKHLTRGQGCPECSHHRSRGEAELLAFVAAFRPTVTRTRDVLSPKELDIWVPDVRVAIEYCGEYWHAARKPEDEAFARRRHIEKLRMCEAAGIRLLTIYESEWLSRRAAIKRLVRHAIGKGRGRVMARQCSVEEIAHSEAAAFFERYHPQGGGGWGTTYGLRFNGKLVACVRFTFGANDRGASATRAWTLTRYATRVAVTGGASRLLAAFVAAHQPETIKSFSDNRMFTGAMYEKLGFQLAAQMEPDYQVYHPKLGLLPKTAWQRRAIPERIAALRSTETFDPETDPRSERDMTYALGGMRLFDCGKKRWVWTRA